MTAERIAVALQRLKSILQRRPSAGLAPDVAALSTWQGGARFLTGHADGGQVLTDLPEALGGDGAGVTPGWLLRAGLAACAATNIVMAAAQGGIELTRLEVEATSRSDARGLLGLCGAADEPVGPGPLDVRLTVRIASRGASVQRLRSLVESARGCSPVAAALAEATEVALSIEAHED